MRPALFFGSLALLSLSCVAQPQGGRPVDFPSPSIDGSSTTTLRGVLYQPGSPERGSLVLVHGSSGWTDVREGHYARAFSAAGYAVLAIDAFGPRGIGSTGEEQTRLSFTQNLADAFAARRYLVAQGHDAGRMAVMGFSRGGLVALQAADRRFLPQEKDRFAAAIPFYPGCNARPKHPVPASAVFMALGEKDDYSGVKPCQDIASDFAAAGGRIVVKVYPDSTHGFDGSPDATRMYRIATVENYMDCVSEVEDDGTLVYRGKQFAQGDLALYAELRKPCMRKGATFYTNLTQKAQATRDVIEFLDRTIGQ